MSDESDEPMFTVDDLREQLKDLDGDLPVILQSDPEGNGFFWGTGVDPEGWVTAADMESDRSESVYTKKDLEDEAEEGEDPYEGYTRVVVLFP